MEYDYEQSEFDASSVEELHETYGDLFQEVAESLKLLAESPTEETIEIDQLRLTPNQLLQRFENENPLIFQEMARYGLNRPLARRVILEIIIFTAQNVDTVSGTPEQRMNAIFLRMRRERPFIFNILLFFRIPPVVVSRIVATVIIFVLRLVGRPIPPIPPEEEPRVREVLAALESQTNILADIRRFGIPLPQARGIARRVIRFTLRNTDPRRCPINLPQRADQLTIQLEAAVPDVFRDLTAAGATRLQARGIVRAIILFTLRFVCR